MTALRVNEGDRPAVEALDAGEVEAQATVLLRKRLDAIRRWLPATLKTLEERAWPTFAAYARVGWPASPAEDARDFGRHLLRAIPAEVNNRELHRAEFAASGRRIAFRLLPRQGALQLLFRSGRDTREWFIRFL